MVRLVEVQLRLRPNVPLPVPAADKALEWLTEVLFPQAGADGHNDAGGRIVRVLPPFLAR